MKNATYIKLALSIILDLIGCLSYIFPGIGEFGDIVWAPASAWIMTKMYKGKKAKIAATISFVEEALPYTDIIPTFTLMWLYVNVFSSEKPSEVTSFNKN